MDRRASCGRERCVWLLAGALLAFCLALVLARPGGGKVLPPCSVAILECYQIGDLLEQREGYGEAATGGLGGRVVQVTSNADTGPGTLRSFVERAREPLWVVFASDMIIELKSQISISSDVTIDGRGRSITLYDWGLTFSNVHNVIVTHIAVDGRFREEAQAANLAQSFNVWLDHLTLARTKDRLVNVKAGSTNVTLTWIRFE